MSTSATSTLPPAPPSTAQEEDDPVIRELDVFVTDSDAILYLLQFPLRPMFMDTPEIVAAKFKPQHRKLQIQLPVTIPSRNDNGRSEHPNQTMVSSKLPQRTGMGVAVIRDGAMHITPLSEVLQMRPSFKNIPNTRDEFSDGSESEEDEDTDKEMKPALEQVHMKRKETERWQQARLQSFSYLQAREANEPWQKLQIHPFDSDASNEVVESLYVSDETKNGFDGVSECKME